MQFVFLQLASIFVATFVFLNHTSDIRKKFENLKDENEYLNSYVQTLVAENAALTEETIRLDDKLQKLKSIIEV